MGFDGITRPDKVLLLVVVVGNGTGGSSSKITNSQCEDTLLILKLLLEQDNGWI